MSENETNIVAETEVTTISTELSGYNDIILDVQLNNVQKLLNYCFCKIDPETKKRLKILDKGTIPLQAAKILYDAGVILNFLASDNESTESNPPAGNDTILSDMPE